VGSNLSGSVTFFFLCNISKRNITGYLTNVEILRKCSRFRWHARLRVAEQTFDRTDLEAITVIGAIYGGRNVMQSFLYDDHSCPLRCKKTGSRDTDIDSIFVPSRSQ
jgi:hypothetical protein